MTLASFPGPLRTASEKKLGEGPGNKATLKQQPINLSRTMYPVWMVGVLPVSQQMLQASEAIKSLRTIVLLHLVEQLLALQVIDKFGVQFTKGATICITKEKLEQLYTQKLVKMLRGKEGERGFTTATSNTASYNRIRDSFGEIQ